MSDIERIQRGYRITGRVQGVFFRVWTREMATELGLRGTVKNQADGSVEAHASGGAHVMDLFRQRLWEGPPASKVDGVEEFSSEATLPPSFEVLR